MSKGAGTSLDRIVYRFLCRARVRWRMTDDRPDRAATAGRRRPVAIAGGVLGLGVGGLFDILVVHLILQRHHVLSGWHDPTTVAGLRRNLVADGLLGTALLVLLLVGIWLLWRAARRPDAAADRSTVVGSALVGWAVFNLLDEIVSHQLLDAHRVAPGPDWLAWRAVFLLVTLAMLAVGLWFVTRRDGAAPARSHD